MPLAPLLARELQRRASDPGRSAQRLLLGLALLLAAYAGYRGVHDARQTARFVTGAVQLGVIGHGPAMLDPLVRWLLLITLVVVPASACGAVVRERREGTLDLLLLTRLGPSSIALQLACGRLLPWLTAVLLSIPLLAMAVTFGGVEPLELAAAVGLTFGLALLLLGWSMACSAAARSLAGALVCTYLTLPLVGGAIHLIGVALGLEAANLAPLGDLLSGEVAISRHPAETWLGKAAVLGAAALLALIAARLLLTRDRPLLPAIGSVQGGLDGALNRLNAQLGGLVFTPDVPEQPGERPIAWRERRLRGVGRLHHVARMAGVGVLGAVLAMVIARDIHLQLAALHGWLALACGLLTLSAARLFARERADGTLDLLRICPLASGSILRQKAAALPRQALLLLLPALVLAAATGNRGALSYNDPQLVTLGLLAYGLGGAALLTLSCALGLVAGLRLRGPWRALLTSAALLAALCLLPMAAVDTLKPPRGPNDPPRSTIGAALAQLAEPIARLSPIAAMRLQSQTLTQGPSWNRANTWQRGLSTALSSAAVALGLALLLVLHLRSHAELLLDRPSALAAPPATE